jgi:ketosteroid isomerase-like protein
MNSSKIYLMAMLGIAFAGMAFSQDMSETERLGIEQAVLKTNAEMVQAAESGDLDKLFGFVLENDRGAVVQDGKILVTRRQVIESTRQGMAGFKKIDYIFEQELVTVLSPSLALLVADGVTDATTRDGRIFSVRFAQSVLFQLQNGKWQVLHAHRSFPANR